MGHGRMSEGCRTNCKHARASGNHARMPGAVKQRGSGGYIVNAKLCWVFKGALRTLTAMACSVRCTSLAMFLASPHTYR